MSGKTLVYFRGSPTSENGVALYRYEDCELLADFPGETLEDYAKVYDQAFQYIEDNDLEYYDNY